jgi:hypothetical protein
MNLRLHSVSLSILCLSLTLLTPLLVTASDWKDTLKKSLETSYPLTHRAALSPDRITEQGVGD